MLGKDCTGVYGEFDVIEKALPAHASYGWQTAAWSRGLKSAKAALYQRIGQVFVAGIQCDVNDILAPDWGQHSGGDMPITDDDAKLIAKHIWYDWIWSGKNADGSAWGLNPSQVLAKLDAANNTESAKVDALAAAIAKVTTDPSITANAVKEWVTEAVKQNVRITGTVEITGKDTDPMAD
ncbi:hypothetical protein [Amycolatopsis vastitatis]|uniref:Uncharacterized protein n=1 Tax=Amycolatopsis vastitatis TaxID=1905142 RepID=A0A229T8E9_9PSEU|nr:hypothetical protein [Amycolatopsis vastitatis]OXM67221.1 hypothetical protein CF165_17420 [Amycolatopsis vastitatis]